MSVAAAGDDGRAADGGGPVIVKQFAWVDVPWTATELDGLRTRIRNAVAMLRYSNEQLREAVEEGDADPQVTTAIAENIEIIEAREVRVEQLTTLLDALRDAAAAGRPVHFVHESQWANVAGPDEADAVVLGLSERGAPGEPPPASIASEVALAMGMDL